MAPIKLTVVGHANVGKTSLLRTLARDSHFGSVADTPGTTRHTEGVHLRTHDDVLIAFFDTPGLEDSIALIEYLEGFTTERRDTFSKITYFLESPEATGRFEQEAKVLRQLSQSDAGLYVIDVREPILPKYQDELEILAYCGKPLLPIFNFTSSPQSKEKEWKEKLAQLGLHLVVRFDTVSPPFDGEKKLYDSLMLLLDNFHEPLTLWLADIEKKRRYRTLAGKKIIADALIDVTAVERWLQVTDDKEEQIEALQNEVRKREQTCVAQLLKLYQFDKDTAQLERLPEIEGRFEHDLFSSEALSQMGIRLSKGAITGALTGAGIDLAVGGMTLGMATALGAVIGGVSQSVRHYGKRFSHFFNGKDKLTVDAVVICGLALRLQALQQALEKRGHAAKEKLVVLSSTQNEWQQGKLPEPLKDCRAHPEWSMLNKNAKLNDPKRSKIVMNCVSVLKIKEKEDDKEDGDQTI